MYGHWNFELVMLSRARAVDTRESFENHRQQRRCHFLSSSSEVQMLCSNQVKIEEKPNRIGRESVNDRPKKSTLKPLAYACHRDCAAVGDKYSTRPYFTIQNASRSSFGMRRNFAKMLKENSTKFVQSSSSLRNTIPIPFQF